MSPSQFELIRQDLKDHESADVRRFQRVEDALHNIAKLHLSTAGTIIMLLLSVVGYILTHGNVKLTP